MFFYENENRTLNVPLSHPHSTVTPITDDLVHRWDQTIGTARGGVQEGHGESLRRDTTQEHAPPSEPSSASCWSSSGRSRTVAHAREDKKSTVSLDHRPPTSAPSTTNRALPPSCEFRVSAFFPLACFVQGLAVSPGCASARLPIPVERGHHGRVDGKLRSSKQGKAVCHHLQPGLASNRLNSAKSRSRTNTLDLTLAPPSRQTLAATDSRAHPRRPQDPCCRASCSVVAKGVEWTATPATAD